MAGNPGEAEGTRKRQQIAIQGYELLEKVGQGAMGTVFRANQVSLDRIVALKILPPSMSQDQSFIERFQKEARAAGKLNHPNIVQGIDVGESNGYFFFAMEFVDGETAMEYMKRNGVVPEEMAVDIVADVARALEHAHEHRLVHGDIKPDNIMLTSKGQAKLCDLGLARPILSDATGKRSKKVMGTPHYISPEQARGQLDIDIRSDIYSLGATLYHMVTGRTPFEGSSSREVMKKHLSEELVSPQDINPLLSDRIVQLIEKMMAKERDDRYESPAELVADAERVRKGRRPVARRLAEGKSQIQRRGNRRRSTRDSRRSDEELPNGLSPQKVIVMAVAGTVALVLVLALLSAAFSGNGEEEVKKPNGKKDRTELAGQGEQIDTNTGDPVEEGPGEDAPSVDELIAKAWEHLEEHPQDFPGAANWLDEAQRAAGRQRNNRVIRARTELKRRQKTARDAQMAVLQRQAEDLAEQRKYEAAEALFDPDAFPAGLLEDRTPYSMRFLSDARGQMRMRSSTDWNTDAKQAKALLDAGKLDEARALMDPWSETDVPEYAERYAEWQEEFEALEAKAAAEAEAARVAAMQKKRDLVVRKIAELLVAGKPIEAQNACREAMTNPELSEFQEQFTTLMQLLRKGEGRRGDMVRGYRSRIGQSGQTLMQGETKQSGRIVSVDPDTIMLEINRGPQFPIPVVDQPWRELCQAAGIDPARQEAALDVGLLLATVGSNEKAIEAAKFLNAAKDQPGVGPVAGVLAQGLREAVAWDLLQEAWQIREKAQQSNDKSDWQDVRDLLVRLRNEFADTRVWTEHQTQGGQ